VVHYVCLGCGWVIKGGAKWKHHRVVTGHRERLTLPNGPGQPPYGRLIRWCPQCWFVELMPGQLARHRRKTGHQGLVKRWLQRWEEDLLR
jgi:hypothetical protein